MDAMSEEKGPEAKMLRDGYILLSEGMLLDRAVSERIRMVRAKIERLNLSQRKANSIVISSALPQEGKSMTSVNLARSFAANPNAKTLLIDCDLRKPSVHRYFGISQEAGLTNALHAGQPIESVVRQVEPGLDVVTAGAIPNDPFAALELNAFREFLDRASVDYRYVLLDSPPILLCPEMMLLSSQADATILVVRAWQTPKKLVKEAANVVGKKKLLGVVLNGSQDSITEYGYNGYYGYAAPTALLEPPR